MRGKSSAAGFGSAAKWVRARIELVPLTSSRHRTSSSPTVPPTGDLEQF